MVHVPAPEIPPFMMPDTVDQLAETFRQQDGAVWQVGLFPSARLRAILDEVEQLRPFVHRSYVPGKKQGGSISAFLLRDHGPQCTALYHDPEWIAWLSRLTGAQLQPCPPSDPHAYALYCYTERGDHIGWHYDTSFYRGKRFTVLLGLIDRSSSRLQCQLYTRQSGRTPEAVEVATPPGTLVVFDGDRLWHAVSPLGYGEERIVFAMEYVTDPNMPLVGRMISAVKDAVAYFGIRALFPKRS